MIKLHVPCHLHHAMLTGHTLCWCIMYLIYEVMKILNLFVNLYENLEIYVL